MNFDIFIVRQWEDGYTLRVEKSRPRNAPRWRHTQADTQRNLAVDRKNQELNTLTFPDLQAVCKVIEQLQIPERSEHKEKVTNE